MSTNKERLLVIENKSYDEFDGFPVRLIGYDKVSYPFSTRGWPGGKSPLKHLKSEFGDFNLTITTEGHSFISLENEPVEVILNIDDFRKLYRTFWQLSRQCKENAMNESLGNLFPNVFIPEHEVSSELPEEIRRIIPSREQLEMVTSFLRRFRNYTLHAQDTIQFFTGGNLFHTIHLENILNEFEGKLGQDLKESEWHTFLKIIC